MGEYSVVLAGNPNTGKSTLFNLLTGLRQHTGNWPGKTVFLSSGRAMYGEDSYKITDSPGAYSLTPRSQEEECTRECILNRPDALIYVCDACALRRSMNFLLEIRERAERLLVCVNLMDEAERRGIELDLELLSQRLGLPVIGLSARKKESRELIFSALRGLLSAPPREISEGESPEPEELNAVSDELCRGVIRGGERKAREGKIISGRLTALPLMLLMLGLIFYITIIGANYPSELLSRLLFGLEGRLRAGMELMGWPWWLTSLLTEGVWRVTAWVTAVMLPPMAIFFPLFSLGEDWGLLPRIAFNLDGPLERCSACGKQALTMCMGFGCNACAVTGCRIMTTEREKMLAMLTNAFIPCNGRFPMLLSLIAVSKFSGGSPAISALILTGIIIFSVFMSLLASKILSASLLKGRPPVFILELPPFRRPEIGRSLLRSLRDRVAAVLGRAVRAAAPAGAILWCLLHVHVLGRSLISYCAAALDWPGQLMGLDGSILLGFILGLPANEIVLPIIIMIYSGASALTEPGSLAVTGELLRAAGWSGRTFICCILFTLMHWPCATTLLSIKKEAGGGKWLPAAALVPTLAGFFCCCAVNLLYEIFL